MEITEEFSEAQKAILKKYVTNTDRHIFALMNLPEVIKGALFSRYSRSSLGLRSLLLKDFIKNDETLFSSIAGHEDEEARDEQIIAIKKAQNFYDRILDGYGDDSIGELGGAHLAIENISMLAAKIIEDRRLGGSPLEKSTRYIYFDQKIKGEYLFYREPIIMTSAHRDVYINMCNKLFTTYGKLIPQLTEVMEEKFPKNPDISKVAYTAALRAKVLDCLRGLLPTSTLTNMGLFGNGRFFEHLLQRLNCETLSEPVEIARQGHEELSKILPSFVRRADPTHRHFKPYQEFLESMNHEMSRLSDEHLGEYTPTPGLSVKLVNYDKNAPRDVAAALLFAHANCPLSSIRDHVAKLPDHEINRILESGVSARKNRRHKSPRALEHASFTFEIVADFGIYRDLQRHRILTQERQRLTCDWGYYTPQEIIDSPMEKPYRNAMEQAKEVYECIRSDLPEEAQYVVPMAYNIQWYFHVNLRSLQWLTELRSSPQGHPAYRYVAQALADETFKAIPEFERFFTFVDFEGYDLGRLDQEIRTEQKKSSEILS